MILILEKSTVMPTWPLHPRPKKVAFFMYWILLGLVAIRWIRCNNLWWHPRFVTLKKKALRE
jgi:hypothetical protein